MPTDACQIDEIDFPPPRMVGGTTEPDTRVGSIEAFSRNGLPPLIKVINVEPYHEILCKMLVVERLKNELGPAVSEPSIAIALPYLLETKVCEETATGLVILAAGNEWEQRPCAEFFHRSSYVVGRVVRMPNGSRLSCGALVKDSFPNLRAPPASSAG